MFDADRFKHCLSAQHISQGELARRVGVSQQTISRLASGDRYGTKHLHRIARALGTTPGYLSGETDDPQEGAETGQRLSSDELEWVALYAGLTPEQRKAVRTLVRGIIGETPSTRIHDQRKSYEAPDQA